MSFSFKKVSVFFSTLKSDETQIIPKISRTSSILKLLIRFKLLPFLLAIFAVHLKLNKVKN
jgi:hypothetical protein